LKSPTKSSKGKKKKSTKPKNGKLSSKKHTQTAEKQDEMINIDIGPELEESAPLKAANKKKL
jgi:hypothetical protein